MSLGNIISTEFPYQSQYVEVLGSKIHYIEEGKGKPILFLHGMPASNYSWRNVIPYLSKHGRCIAPDFIGTGYSDKPDIGYRVFDHIKYIEAFIDALQLKDITLVLHGFGSIIGFDYAMRHENNIHALVFFESHIRPDERFQNLSLPVQELIMGLQSFNKELDSLTGCANIIQRLLCMCTMRKLKKDEVNHYLCNCDSKLATKPIAQYLKDYPHEYGSKEVLSLIAAYSKKLEKSHLPKLMFYAVPGFNTTIDTVVWARDHLTNLTLEDLGEDMHFMQETNPHTLGEKIAVWFQQSVGATV